MSLYAKNTFEDLLVISKDEEKGTFVGENLRHGIIKSELKIKDYFFYEFC